MSKILDILFRTRRQGDGIDQTKKGVDGVNDSAEKGKGKAAAWGRAWKAAGDMAKGSLSGIVGTLQSIGSFGVKTIVGLTAATAGSIREFVVFNTTMARAWTMMSVGKEEFEGLRRQIVGLSTELGVAKDALASGLYQALSAGVPKDNVVEFLRTAAKVAVADGSTIETAVDGITTVLNSYQVPAAEAEKITDKLFKTVANGKTTFSQLAASISQAAPVAASMGVDLDQLLAGVASLTKNGVPTATAMVLIRNSLLTVNEQLGDGWAKTQSFQEALEGIAKQANYSQQALTEMFGRETVAGVAALTGANFGKAAADLQAMQDSAGSLGGAFAKVDSQISHWSKFWQNIRALISDVGQAVDAQLKPALDYVSTRLDAFRQGEGFKTLIADLGTMIGGLVDNLIAGLGTAAAFFKNLRENGLSAAAASVKTLLVEMVDVAVTTLLEFLRASISVFVGIGKAIGAAVKEEVLSLDIPGINGVRTRAAEKTLDDMTEEEAVSLGVEPGRAGPQPYSLDRGSRERYLRDNPEIAAKLAARNAPEEMDEAFAQTREALAGSRDRLGERIGQAGRNVSAAAKAEMNFDPSADFARRKEEIRQQAPAAPEQQEEIVAAVTEMTEQNDRTSFAIITKIEQFAQRQKELEERLRNLPL
jgi:TP901 family phage tail tape measure protein